MPWSCALWVPIVRDSSQDWLQEPATRSKWHARLADAWLSGSLYCVRAAGTEPCKDGCKCPSAGFVAPNWEFALHVCSLGLSPGAGHCQRRSAEYCSIIWPCVAWTRIYAAAAQSVCQHPGIRLTADLAGACRNGRHQLLAMLPGTLARLITRPLAGCTGRLFVRAPTTLQMAFFCMQDQPISELDIPRHASP